MKPGLVSVTMPAYNAEAFIGQAIESVLAQSNPHWELVIVDDGSSDRTAEIASSYGDPRIRLVRLRRLFNMKGMNGLLVPPGDARVMADAIKRLISDGELRTRLGQQAGQDAMQKHSWDKYLSGLEDLYYSLILKGRQSL